MDVLPVSCNEDVVGIEVFVMDTRPREISDEAGGTSQGFSVRVSAVVPTPGAVVLEEHLSQSPGVSYELGDQIGPVEDARWINRGRHDSRCGQT